MKILVFLLASFLFQYDVLAQQKKRQSDYRAALVKVVLVNKTNLYSLNSAFGRIISIEPYSIVSKVNEEVKKIFVLEGAEVIKGQKLIELESKNIKRMRARYKEEMKFNKNTLKLLKSYDCMYVLMHSKGTPQTMQNNPIYNNVVCDIYNFFKKKLMTLKKMNISEDRIILDPGIGFAKNLDHNYEVLKNLSVFLDLGHPLMIGVSRKSLIKNLTKENTLTPSVLLAVDAYSKGAKIIRVHDVQETKEAIKIYKKAN